MEPGYRNAHAEAATTVPLQAGARARFLDSLDVWGAIVLALVAAAATQLAPETGLRLALTLPAIFLVPGYLFLQALFVPARPRGQRAIHALVAVGVSPAIVGALALLTAATPFGFRETAIVVTVTAASLLLGAVTLARRAMRPVAPAHAVAGTPFTVS